MNEDKDRWNDNGLSFAKTYKTTQSFAVGPGPVTVEIGATGKLGMDIAASVGHDFEVFAEPFLDFKVYGEGGVGGGLAGWKLGAGVGAEMSLVKQKFHAGITATVDFDQESSVLKATFTEQVSNAPAGPTGRLYLWATAKGKILWATINRKWEYTLVKWESFRKEDTLFEGTQAVSCELP